MPGKQRHRPHQANASAERPQAAHPRAQHARATPVRRARDHAPARRATSRKTARRAQLAAAIRKVAGGGAFITAEVAEQLALGAMPEAEAAPHSVLSDREFQVLRSLVSGKTVSEIAESLNLSVKTVSTHKARLMEKIGVENKAELFRYAMRHGLIES